MPEEWETKKLGSVLERVVNPVEVDLERTYQEIGIRSHGKGLFDKEPVTGKDLGNKRVYWIHPNCFIVNIVFAWEQAVGKTREADLGKIASHRFPMYYPKNEKVDVDYLVHFFHTPRGKYLLGLASPGGAGRNKTLGQKEFSSLRISLPSIEEQQKIALILTCWDKAIGVTENLLKVKTKLKRGLMQQLLAGDKKWKTVAIRDCCEILDKRRKPLNAQTRKKMKGNIPYYGANGVLDYINEYIFDEDLILIAEDGGYFEKFSTDPIAYQISGKSWVNNHAHVLRARDGYSQGIIFYSLVHKNIIRYLNSGTRSKLNRGELEKIEIRIPLDSNEQSIIVTILSTCDKEIETLNKKLEALKQQKKGLMQTLLTGKVPVKIDSEPLT